MRHKLLLADDSVTIQRVIELTFADEDVQVVAVSDGDQAIARLEAESPDIVLADIGMPGRDGYQVAEYIRNSPKLAHVPVLLLTGAFEPVDESRARAVGCNGVLAKPFEPQLVISRVKELLDRPAGAGDGPDPGAVPARETAGPAGSAPTWPPKAPEPAVAAAPPGGAPAANPDVEGLDTYFDRLDEAFAKRASPPPDMPLHEAAPGTDTIEWPDPDAAPAEAPSDAARETAWTIGADADAASTPADVPASYASPAPAVEPAAAPTAGAAAPAIPSYAGPPAPVTPPPPVLPSALPSLADAFAALLAAEQASPDAAAARWPAPSGAAAPAAIDESVIEEVTRRVLDRLTDRVVRETATDLVPAVAERLVRDEIDRIKASVP